MSPSPKPPDLGSYLSRATEAEIEFRRLFRTDETLVIFDIGACEGEDSIRYARLFPRAKVFAFEPLPPNQAIIRANFERYGVSNAELVPIALSDRSGQAAFHVSSGRPPELFAGEDWNYGNKSSSLLPPAGPGPMHGWIEFKETITVETETLDRICAARAIEDIAFIHMDVQGAEDLVLTGAEHMLPRTGAVWLEVSRRENYRGQALSREIAARMGRHGFRLLRESWLGGDTGEGDQLYLNLRRWRTWRYCAAGRLRAIAGRAGRRLRSR